MKGGCEGRVETGRDGDNPLPDVRLSRGIALSPLAPRSSLFMGVR
ncbi:hypothetical protein HDE78_001127 [Rhodanobacter sp. K2T2]|nr:hypothetical protein [Rhodanobacter sp. K2T2]